MNGTRTTSIPTWVRVGLVALGLPNAAAGLWAVLAPESWYERFPGWDPRLVAAEPPFNAHLVTDAGSGLLASGVVLLVAAWLADPRSTRLAVVAFAAFAVPHTAFHALNPSPLLSSAEDAQNVAVLVFSVVAAVALLIGAGWSRRKAAGPLDTAVPA
jgi:hypothetical protein